MRTGFNVLKFVKVRCHIILKCRAGISDFDAMCSATAFW